MLIGVYVLLLAVAIVCWSLTFFIVRELFAMLSAASPYDFFASGALALLGSGLFLFIQYCLRLRGRRFLITSTMLWRVTAAHALGIIAWLGLASWHEHLYTSTDFIFVLLAVSTVPFIVFLLACIPLSSANAGNA